MHFGEEEYTDGQLRERRLYGLAIDELVRIESDLTGDGALETVLQPLYDATGNVALVTGGDGRILERYDNDPYGERRIYVDLTGPRVEQLRVVGDQLWLEVSEEVMAEAVARALDEGTLVLVETVSGTPVAISGFSQPVREGRQAGRRLVLELGSPPSVATAVELTIPAEALRDGFGNIAAEPFDHTFDWPETDAVLLDETPPRVAKIAVKGGLLEIELSEEPDLAGAAAEIQVAGQSLDDWTLDADRYTLRSDAALPQGNHELIIGTGALDLAGLGLTEAVQQTVAVGGADSIVYQAPDEREIETSSVGNSFGFHGRSYDAETGLMYFRNRWYDPEMGRFVTADPLGYVDGPSQYAFAGYDPINHGDPLGLYMTDVHFYAIYYLSRAVGFTAAEAHAIGFASQYVDNSRELTPDPRNGGILNNNYLYGSTREALKAVHFPGPSGVAVQEGNVFAQAGVVLAARRGNLTRLGVALHSYADSFSHAGFVLERNRRINSREGGGLIGWLLPVGHMDSGHGATGQIFPTRMSRRRNGWQSVLWVYCRLRVLREVKW